MHAPSPKDNRIRFMRPPVLYWVSVNAMFYTIGLKFVETDAQKRKGKGLKSNINLMHHMRPSKEPKE